MRNASSPAWQALLDHAASHTPSIADLFAAEPDRAQSFCCEFDGLYLDYSKQRANRETLRLLQQLAKERDLGGWTQRMFSGDAINHTENRAVLHAALRAPRGADIRVNGENVVPAVHEVLDRMAAFAARLRADARITDVVNIGIGGSDLGPRMVCDVLQDFADGPRVHFVANVDATQLTSLLKKLDAAKTLFIITSKTFTTQETMANAQAARAWFLGQRPASEIPAHFVAVSTNAVEVGKFGIHRDNMFGFWDWVGGRYSLWSAVGLSIMISLGEKNFRDLLAGAHAMDGHFRNAPHERNLPVLLALLNVWNFSFLRYASQVIAPYAQRLDKFIGWLQQLEMESNGKSVTRDGSPVACITTPALWGDIGTNSQHAFFQMLHQGSAIHPVDFILPIRASHELAAQHEMLLANCLAQSSALMRGKNAAEVRAELSARGMSGDALEQAIPHRVFAGNRPSNTLLMSRLDPYNLGLLLALYEHRTFVQSVLWNINAFDQWGVELGKQLTQNILKAMQTGEGGLDASTAMLLKRIKS